MNQDSESSSSELPDVTISDYPENYDSSAPQDSNVSNDNTDNSGRGGGFKKRLIIIISVVVLIAVSSGIGGYLFFAEQRLNEIKERDNQNKAIIEFQNLFVEKVLKTQGEVSVEDRLKLQNAVTNTNNKNIQEAWSILLESETEAEAQARVLVLLNLFTVEVQY